MHYTSDDRPQENDAALNVQPRDKPDEQMPSGGYVVTADNKDEQ